MNDNRISGSLSGLASRLTTTRLIMLAMVVTFTLLTMQPAQAQSSDTWKSVAIIGGSTAAGAYVGHKIAGSKGAWIGAGVGATAGYAIDRRRRANQYNNQYGYNNPGYYDPNGDYGNSGYYGGPDDGAPYPGYLQNPSTKYSANTNQRGSYYRGR